MQVASDNTQLVRVILSRSRSNIKVTFLKKMAVLGALVFHKHMLFHKVFYLMKEKFNVFSKINALKLDEAKILLSSKG